jgi:hypothetical protein
MKKIILKKNNYFNSCPWGKNADKGEAMPN